MGKMDIFIEIKWSTNGQLTREAWKWSKSNFRGILGSKQNSGVYKGLAKN